MRLVRREPHGKKEPLAELLRLLEQDEEYCAISRSRPAKRVNFPPSQAERPQPPHTIAMPSRSKRDREGVASSHGSPSGAGAASASAREAASSHPENRRLDAKRGSRRGLGLVAAMIVLIVLMATATALGYFAWVTVPSGSARESLFELADAAHKWLDTKTLALRSERKAGSAEPAVARKGTLVEGPTASPLHAPPSTQDLSNGSGPAPSADPASIDPGPLPSSDDEQTINRRAVVSDQVANAPSKQTTQPQPTDTASAPGSATTAITEPGEPSGAVAAGIPPAPTYVVQLSSQRTDKAAQSTAQTLQGKYRAMFGGRQPFIRRSDLGVKGVYFRVLLGPFGTSQEANQFCGNLKKMGGDCIVQRN